MQIQKSKLFFWYRHAILSPARASKYQQDLPAQTPERAALSQQESRPTSLESSTSSSPEPLAEERSGWLKWGIVAAASAVAGGMAAAWWYRKTLAKLHQSAENGQNPDFRISSDDPHGED